MRKIVKESLYETFQEESDPIKDMSIGIDMPADVAEKIKVQVKQEWEKCIKEILEDEDIYESMYDLITDAYYRYGNREGDIDWPLDLEDFDIYKDDYDIDLLREKIDEIMIGYQGDLFYKIAEATASDNKSSPYFDQSILDDMRRWEEDEDEEMDLQIQIQDWLIETSGDVWNTPNAVNYVIDEAWNIMPYLHDKKDFLDNVNYYEYMLENKPDKEYIKDYQETVETVLKNE